MITQFVKEALAGKIDLVAHTEKALEEAEKINKEYRYVTAWGAAVERAKELQEQVKILKNYVCLIKVF